jgi:hypothetical protein
MDTLAFEILGDLKRNFANAFLNRGSTNSANGVRA